MGSMLPGSSNLKKLMLDCIPICNELSFFGEGAVTKMFIKETKSNLYEGKG